MVYRLVADGRKVSAKKYVRKKAQYPVQEVDQIDVNPSFAYIGYPDGRESTVSISDLAPIPPRNDNAANSNIPLEPQLNPTSQLNPNSPGPAYHHLESSLTVESPETSNNHSPLHTNSSIPNSEPSMPVEDSPAPPIRRSAGGPMPKNWSSDWVTDF